MAIRLGLRGKLLAVTLGLLAVLTVGALLTVRHYFGSQLRRQAARELQAGAQVLSAVFERSGVQLRHRATILVGLPSLQDALATRRQQLEPLLMEVKAIRAANLLWATDAHGLVVASTGEYPPVGQPMHEDPFTAAALRGQEVLGFDRFGGELWLLLCVPVTKTGTTERLGAVTLALLIGDSYVARVAELMGCQIGFLWGGHQLWSAGWPPAARVRLAPAAIIGLTGPPRELTLWQQTLLWLARPVTGGSASLVTGPIAVLGLPLDEAVIQQTTRGIGGVAVVTMVIGALFSILGIRSVTRPLKRLVTDSQRIGAGDLAHRSRVQGTDEVGELAASFNQMVGRLQASHDELVALNQTLEARVRQRSRELEDAQAQLVQAEKLASIGQLAAGVAHELNSPLMVIMGNTQLARRMLAREGQLPPLLQAELNELLQMLDQEAHRAKSIISGLLDFARTRPATLTAVDVNAALEESLALVGHAAGLQEIQVVKQYAPQVPEVRGDPGQLKQVFVNVILNAVQAMPQGGTLALMSDASETLVTVAIRDTGVGIPAAVLPKVFDPFMTTKPVGLGTGLGLSISYSIIQRHGGTITIASEEGRGTTVTIHLPRPVEA